MIKDFLTLIFPKVCNACRKALYKSEDCICAYCHYHLPKTNFHLNKENPISKTFWGRAAVEEATSLYYFNKGTKVQHLIHQLKYRGKKEIGYSLGKHYGVELKNSRSFSTIDLVIPVPLFPSKQKKRGYNQSELFAKGLAESLSVESHSEVLIRKLNSQSQTKKTRFDRWKNVEFVFEVTKPEVLHGKHILLVDDVITTGATLEACANRIIEVPGSKVSIATIASTLF